MWASCLAAAPHLVLLQLLLCLQRRLALVLKLCPQPPHGLLAAALLRRRRLQLLLLLLLLLQGGLQGGLQAARGRQAAGVGRGPPHSGTTGGPEGSQEALGGCCAPLQPPARLTESSPAAAVTSLSSSRSRAASRLCPSASASAAAAASLAARACVTSGRASASTRRTAASHSQPCRWPPGVAGSFQARGSAAAAVGKCSQAACSTPSAVMACAAAAAAAASGRASGAAPAA